MSASSWQRKCFHYAISGSSWLAPSLCDLICNENGIYPRNFDIPFSPSFSLKCVNSLCGLYLLILCANLTDVLWFYCSNVFNVLFYWPRLLLLFNVLSCVHLFLNSNYWNQQECLGLCPLLPYLRFIFKSLCLATLQSSLVMPATEVTCLAGLKTYMYLRRRRNLPGRN